MPTIAVVSWATLPPAPGPTNRDAIVTIHPHVCLVDIDVIGRGAGEDQSMTIWPGGYFGGSHAGNSKADHVPGLVVPIVVVARSDGNVRPPNLACVCTVLPADGQ